MSFWDYVLLGLLCLPSAIFMTWWFGFMITELVKIFRPSD